ncbi:MAG: NACHT domain-containing protein, partial [Symploca sp. SIO2G7]|nr:NACHT domain-containing protein [Symploca sp. SIO2G7]
MPRSIRVAPEYISQVKQAPMRQGFPSQRALALDLGLSRSTITSFLNGKPITFLNFVEISERLGLDWQAIAYIKSELRIKPGSPSEGEQIDEPHTGKSQSSDIDALVQKVRQHCHDKIQMLYDKMQLLDISQPVELDNLYINVNILQQLTSQQWLDVSELLQKLNPTTENFDRLGLGKVRQKRVPGFEAIKKYARLMVLGKPGSGKTTFLQHLAIECNQGRFQANRVPIFIRLKNFADYAKNKGDFRLLNYISREFFSCGISEQEVTETLLNQGRGLILLDGLDEVSKQDDSKIIRQIRQFSEDYYQNQFVITCRIAASKYRFMQENFIPVEVADFNSEQIKSFAKKWFVAVAKDQQENGLAKAEQFLKQLKRPENQQIRELAVTPILLNLVCLVFQVRAAFPSNRAKLYEQGLNILLVKWDEARGVQRDKVYRNLSVPRKKQLLSQVAAMTFEKGDYFFEQDKIQQIIADFLCTLPDTRTELDEIPMSSKAVLKAIEAQHGLLVERAREIYSFSHLTFQEYFTARKIVISFEAHSLAKLVSHITDIRWREIFVLVAGILPNADKLLLLMKQKIDELVNSDNKLQQFLNWINQKSSSVDTPYKSAAVRAFYFDLGCAFNLVLSHTLDPAFKTLYLVGDALFLAFDRGLVIDLYYALYLDGIDYAFEDIYLYYVLDFSFIPGDYNILDYVFYSIFDCIPDFGLKRALQKLKEQLPKPDIDLDIVKQWWRANGKDWAEQLRTVLIEHRNIGHDWQFTEHQQQLLKQYYDANKLLVDCLHSSSSVTSAVREEIEETLLLSSTAIEKFAPTNL